MQALPSDPPEGTQSKDKFMIMAAEASSDLHVDDLPKFVKHKHKGVIWPSKYNKHTYDKTLAYHL